VIVIVTKRDGNIPTGTPTPNGGVECMGYEQELSYRKQIARQLRTE